MKHRLYEWIFNKFKVPPWKVNEALLSAAKSVLTGVGIGLGAVVAFSSQSLVASVIEYGTLSNIAAGIESLRSDLHQNPCNEFLQARASEVNQRIAYEQRSNQRLLTGWASPDGWLGVLRIEEKCNGLER